MAASLCVLTASLATPASADVVSTSGMVVHVEPPADVRLDQRTSGDSIIVFDEMQDAYTSAPVDAVLDASVRDIVRIEEGTNVDSHLLHVDLPSDVASAELEGTVRFSRPILGLVVTYDGLLATDDLGPMDTVYGTEPDRQLDLGLDEAMVIGDGTELYVFLRTDTALDHIRVLTVATPGAADTAVPDTGAPPPDTGTPMIDTGGAPADTTRFRGAGGCACRASHPVSADGIPGLSILLVLLSRPRRR